MKKFFLVMLVAVLLCAAVVPAFAADAITIGWLGPITGGNAAEGSAARNAFELAVKQQNESGEFPFEIKVIYIDDQSTPDVGVAGSLKIVDEPTTVIATGHWNSGVAAATIPVFIENEIPLLIWGAIRNGLTNPGTYPWVTRSAPTAVQENQPLAAIVLDDLGMAKVFIVSETGTYGEGNVDAFKAELESRGLAAIGTENVPEDTADFRAIVEKIKASGADTVYWGGTIAGSMLKAQMHEAGLDAVLWCSISGSYSSDFFKVGAEAAEGALVMKPGVVLSSTEVGVKFVADYTAAGYSEPINAYTPYSYEAALILFQSIRDVLAGGLELNPETMRDAVAASETSGIMGITTFNEFGQTTNVAAYLNKAVGGEWVVVE